MKQSSNVAMFLTSLKLQNFRSYAKAEFNFSQGTTVIVGPNTAGKTNLIEAVYLLSRGKSFRTEKDIHMIKFGKEIARVCGEVQNEEDVTLEIVLTTGNVSGIVTQGKKYLVNGVAKRRIDFTTHMPSVLFAPSDLDILVGSPGLRRHFMDEVLEQVDREYVLSFIAYGKALRQRNSLLERAREEGKRNEKEFAFWDALLIKHGQLITKKREDLIHFVNNTQKNIFDFAMLYDKSVISKERLLQYKDAEMGAGVTLVGPHRDDFRVEMFDPSAGHSTLRDEPSGSDSKSSGQASAHDVKIYGSRGQQRLSVLQLKLLQLLFIEHYRNVKPLLLLDDIFSELDVEHIALVHEIIPAQQTIITATHKEFINKKALKEASVIELG